VGQFFTPALRYEAAEGLALIEIDPRSGRHGVKDWFARFAGPKGSTTLAVGRGPGTVGAMLSDPTVPSGRSPEPRAIVLATLNARFIHAAFGLRYLMANLGELASQAEVLEFTINQRPFDIVESILAREPQIIGLGVYIWNAVEMLEVVTTLKRLRPQTIIVLGGPEVSYECDQQEIVRLADYVITGEADMAFRDLCRLLLTGEKPPFKIIAAPLPKMEDLVLPYDLYTDEDVAHRVIYVEASRGCPFTCEFCLSSLDIPVRALAMDRLLPELERLLERGVTQFKFVDRTFNLNLHTSKALLEFFLARISPGLFLHFEMIPDRLPEGLREVIAQFPPGMLQFEVGIQTFDALASKNISRRNNHEKLADNFHYLRGQTGVHIHADLIVGLPGEGVESFGRGFDRLLALKPQEIQIGILKRLRGTPIIRHDVEWQMLYGAHPPYEVLQTRDIAFPEMQEMRRFAKFWDLIGNSGNFLSTLPLIWIGTTPFVAFRQLALWLWAETGQCDGLHLQRLMELLFRWLVARGASTPREIAATLWADYQRPRGGQGDRPPRFIAEALGLDTAATSASGKKNAPLPDGPARQSRHRPAPGGVVGLLLAGVLWCLGAQAGFAQGEYDYDRDPIRYSDTTPHDAVQALEARLAAGSLVLPSDERERLTFILKELAISSHSQILVSSKTSVQVDRIDPRHPRALYFSDEAYVGYVQGGKLEFAVIDPALGPIFYTLEHEGITPMPRRGERTPVNAAPRRATFVRDERCLDCHGGIYSDHVPGVFVRSIPTTIEGSPLTQLGAAVVDHGTEFDRRWGGWYVTGTHGHARHLGNAFASEKEGQLVQDRDAGANVTNLSRFLDTSAYLVPTSDIVALMVIEHQTLMQNLLTRAHLTARQRLAYQQGLQRDLGEPVTETPQGSTLRVFESLTRDVLDGLLFRDEIRLPEGGIEGSAPFQSAFKAPGPRSPRTTAGRSLRDFQHSRDCLSSGAAT
jgi:radical SAM superfamily enzyme YgiQ (UPF0313 family)